MESLLPTELSEISDPTAAIDRTLSLIMGLFLLTGLAQTGAVFYGSGEMGFTWKSNILQFSDSPLEPRPEPYRTILVWLDILLGILLVIGELRPESLFHIRGRTTISFSGPLLRVSESLENHPAVPVITRALDIFLGIFMLIPGHLFLTGIAPLRPGRVSLAVTGPPFLLSTSHGTTPGNAPASTVGLVLRVIVAWFLIFDLFSVSAIAVGPEAFSFTIHSPLLTMSP